MNTILILADSFNAEAFLHRIGQKDASGNNYVVVSPGHMEEDIAKQSFLEFHHFDPTSAIKLSKVIFNHNFTTAFIMMSSSEEAHACLDNIRSADESMEIVILDEWGSFSVLKDTAAHVVNSSQLVANRLYDHLPNVPVVAQNVGLSQGEVMEVLVPYGSSFAYRHIGSIAQIKWKIAAVYRDGKQILPTNATMIRPQDMLLILGKPQVLESVYRRISKNKEKFPEPFGKYLYLLLDMQMDESRIFSQIGEAIHLLDRLEESKLYIRLINPGDLSAVESVRTHARDNIQIDVIYGEIETHEIIIKDTHEFDVGLVLIDPLVFRQGKIADEILGLNKLVFLFGDSPLFSVERLAVLLSEEKEMESISSTFFYVAEALDLKPCLCYYEPDGDFEHKKRVVEHYETLAKIFQYPLKVDKKSINPIKAIGAMNHILQVAPFTKELQEDDLFKIFSTKLSDYLLDSTQHPKLLIPAETQ
jgi:hypothetical protein